jgi:hypothetical protein
MTDYHLLYRDQLAGGGVGTWHESPDFDNKWSWTSVIWNPHKFGEKALFDLVQELIQYQRMTEDAASKEELSVNESGLSPVRSESIKLTTSYILILNYVSRHPRSNLSVATQFMIMGESGVDGAIEPVFLSDFHNI